MLLSVCLIFSQLYSDVAYQSVAYKKRCIKFDNNCYSVKLPMKEYHLQVPDNYELTWKLLYHLRERLANDEVILKSNSQLPKIFVLFGSVLLKMIEKVFISF